MGLMTERYSDKIEGVLSCLDRVVIQGTLPGLCYAEGMTSYLYAKGIRIFDYTRFAEPLRDALRKNAERLAEENGLSIEFVRHHDERKEKKIEKILEQRGRHPGLVAILSAMEFCASYEPWHDKKTGKTYLKPAQGKCLHYYFYFIDEQLGMCYVRVPTWCPFRLQVYFNGHNWLAGQLTRRGIDFTLVDNAFRRIEDWKRAQQLAEQLNVAVMHRCLDRFANRYCPVIGRLGVTYHWSLMQVEYATDIVFSDRQRLQAIYEHLIRTAIHTVKPDHVATFLSRRLDPRYQDELGNDFHTRIEGTCIKHHMGPVSIKMYDKFGFILRIETTVNNVSFFKHYREVEHRDGVKTNQWAVMKKGIYSLPALRPLLQAANGRYLEFISAIDDPSAGVRALDKVSKTITENERSYRGFNFFDQDDVKLFLIIARGEFNISGFQNKSLRRHLTNKNCGQVSRILKRLRKHALIKKIHSTYKYYLTKLGRQVVQAGLTFKHLVLTPQLAAGAP